MWSEKWKLASKHKTKNEIINIKFTEREKNELLWKISWKGNKNV